MPIRIEIHSHLDHLIPTAGHDDRVHDVRREADAGDPVIELSRSKLLEDHINIPLGVAILLDVVLALAKGVPELDRAVACARDDLPVVGREADGEDVGGVADEAAGGRAGVEVPEAESVVPGRRERELAVGGDDDVRDEVVVAVEDALRVAVLILVTGELPDDDRLVCTSCKASTPCPSILPRLRLS